MFKSELCWIVSFFCFIKSIQKYMYSPLLGRHLCHSLLLGGGGEGRWEGVREDDTLKVLKCSTIPDNDQIVFLKCKQIF